MSKVNMYFATGYEEVEALTVVDLLRRVGIEVDMVSISEDMVVTGSHGIGVNMDKTFEASDKDVDMLILPGGIPGTPNLKAHSGLCDLIKSYNETGKYIAAICAAPTVFGALGLLENKSATCYPGMEEELCCKTPMSESVVIDGNIITSRGLGTAIDFALAIITVFKGRTVAEDLAGKIVYS